MSIGKKIKKLRTSKGVTQEKLADYLNVSFQAVSKWENESTYPDITLLPLISTYFGVTIDDLFTLNDDAHMERINNMLMTERTLSSQDEAYIRNHLMGQLDSNKNNDVAYGLLANLSNHRSKSYQEDAILYAKKALQLQPKEKGNHVSFVEASRGVFTDWNYTNHHEIINFYINFISENPDYHRGYMYLLDHLIADGRIQEAQCYLEKMKACQNDYRVLWYKGRIEIKSGHMKKAFDTFNDMVDSDPDNWLVWATRADEYARVCQYEKSIQDNLRAFELQPKPRYIDALECMAHIYEIQGNIDMATAMWEESKVVLRNEWNITFGEPIDHKNRMIERLKTL